MKEDNENIDCVKLMRDIRKSLNNKYSKVEYQNHNRILELEKIEQNFINDFLKSKAA